MEDGNGVKDSKQQQKNSKAKVAPVLKTSVNPAGTSADLPCHYPLSTPASSYSRKN